MNNDFKQNCYTTTNSHNETSVREDYFATEVLGTLVENSRFA